MRISGDGSLGTHAVEREEHLRAGPAEGVVLAAATGVDLDDIDAEGRFDLSVGVLDDRRA